MAQPQIEFVNCPDASGGHRMAYAQWGDALSPHVVVCVHGLSRQGRDFDVLAQALVDKAGGAIRVICPDVVGRGKSDWLKDPMGYQVPVYAGDMVVMLAKLNAEAPIKTLDWVGTSMGGLIGMGISGQPGLPLPVPVHKLVLNDVGPDIQWSAIQRIGTYLGKTGRFESLQQAADSMWAISTSFGPHTPEQWLALSTHMVKPLEGDDSSLTLHYDPAIAGPMSELNEESSAKNSEILWHIYDNIKAQTLLVRGANSDLLTTQTAKAMTERGPKAKLVEFAGVGHAPTLVAADQVEAVLSFLLP